MFRSLQQVALSLCRTQRTSSSGVQQSVPAATHVEPVRTPLWTSDCQTPPETSGVWEAAAVAMETDRDGQNATRWRTGLSAGWMGTGLKM